MLVGVLSVQGSFMEHAQLLREMGCRVRAVKAVEDLQGLSGLIIPGGESTTIASLLKRNKLAGALPPQLPIFGTCAGMIMLARRLLGRHKEGQGLLKRMDIEVERNAYGRQRESFEADVELSWDARPFRAVFIRAPRIVKHGPDVKVLAWHKATPVLARQGSNLACAFHPELTEDDRVHRYFVEELICAD